MARSSIPLRIGIWFDARHMAYGGPTLVILGAILGLYKDAETTQRPVVLLINEAGDVNWNIDGLKIEEHGHAIPNITYGPLCFSIDDAETKEFESHPLWKYGERYLIASGWYKWCISRGLPFDNKDVAGKRSLTVWGSGVDIDRFCPTTRPKTQDYFIYFKSQTYGDLETIHRYLFQNYFHYTGSVLTYYHYDHAMLLEVAQRSRFCIMLDKTETQGLAALEIMATGCPMFVLDWTTHTCKTFLVHGASSVPCWDARCGLKSSMETFEKDFPTFVEKVSTYTPRAFVSERYSFEASAHNLRDLITRKHHEC